MTSKPKIRVLSIFFAVCAVIVIGWWIKAAATGYAQGGGTVAIGSHTVEIDGNTNGSIVTTGWGDVAIVQPENAVHKTGEWLGAAFWGVLLVTAVWMLAMLRRNRDAIMRQLLEPAPLIVVQPRRELLPDTQNKIIVR